jgi:hypothetical protein
MQTGSVDHTPDAEELLAHDWVDLGPPNQGMARLPYVDIRGPAANAFENFEEFCCELAIVVESLPAWTTPYGRRGHQQAGIDVLGVTPAGSVIALQCKLEDPPAGSKAKVTKLERWITTYAAGHARHQADRLVICVPWPPDTGVTDYLRELATKHRSDSLTQPFDVEIWNQNILDRHAAAYPEIIHRYFGKAYARAAEALNARQRAAAVRVGVDRFFNLTHRRSNAEGASQRNPKARSVTLTIARAAGPGRPPSPPHSDVAASSDPVSTVLAATSGRCPLGVSSSMISDELFSREVGRDAECAEADVADDAGHAWRGDDVDRPTAVSTAPLLLSVPIGYCFGFV